MNDDPAARYAPRGRNARRPVRRTGLVLLAVLVIGLGLAAWFLIDAFDGTTIDGAATRDPGAIGGVVETR